MTTSLGTALITGASTGIGATYADRLAKRGYDLILVARNVERLETLAARFRAESGGKVDVLPADLTAEADIARVERRLDEDATITLLVNNAGMSLNGGVLENGAADIRRLLTLNVETPARLASIAGKAFVARGAGSIVNVASVLALAPELGEGTYGLYGGTKAFLLALSQGMATQGRAKGLYVQAVLPGATRTEIWERSGKDIGSFPPEIVMDVNDLVDAALVGFDRREEVTIPPLAEVDQWEALHRARVSITPKLNNRDVAPRYRETRTG
ncbi:SDR family NAD(P)-dependent oxidoreductase [Ferirhizobium litorale]|uniref:SDR family NAD(P)-dependent oxidoreductase n=1 Tax=Ferirhizobium litorale TaxID=2927786 RepID=A0AAE3QFL2_9HYPH|nr:SDR family NAD(P)-dependent oxidoreductase [Fererhizobium litorale]MDI7924902.1 SDR family NAD(P)-dependent oxidoreductase [Fererhizobium litorale]